MRRSEGTVTFDPKRDRWIARLWVRDRDGNGRRLQRSAPTQRLAREALAKLIEEHRVKKKPAPSREPWTLERWANHLSEHVWPATLSTRTTEIYRSLLRRRLLPAFGRKRLTDLDPVTIQRWLSSVESPRQANLARSLLRAILNQAKRTIGEPAENPVSATTRRKQKPFDPRILTIEETRALLEAADGLPIYGPIALALACGLRKGEVSGLTWDRVKRDEIVVLAEKTSRFRTVPLPRAVAGYLATLERDGPWVFATPGGARWDHSNLHREYHKATVRAGLGKITFHCLRSTWASRMVAAGTDVRTLMELGGWSEVATLMEIYARAAKDTKREAVERVSESLF